MSETKNTSNGIKHMFECIKSNSIKIWVGITFSHPDSLGQTRTSKKEKCP